MSVPNATASGRSWARFRIVLGIKEGPALKAIIVLFEIHPSRILRDNQNVLNVIT